MIPIKSFDPTNLSAINGQFDTKGVNLNEQLMLYNNSPVALVITFSDGTKDVMPPNWAKDFIKPTVAMGVVQVSNLFTLVGVGTFNNLVYGVLYEPGEHIPSVNSSLGFGNVAVAQATSVLNTNSPPGTSIVFGDPVGDTYAGGATNITNSGTISLGDALNAGFFQIVSQSNVQLTMNDDSLLMQDAAGTETIALVGLNTPYLEIRDDAKPSTRASRLTTDGLGGGQLILSYNGTDELVLYGNATTQVNGTSGAYTKSFPIWGTAMKIAIITFGSYVNTATSTITFPGTGMGRGIFWFWGGANMTFTLSSGNVSVITALGTATTSGGDAGATTVHSDNMGWISTTVTGIVLSIVSVAENGAIIFVGA